MWGFVAVTVPLVMTPGASTAIVLRNSLAGGTRAGCITALGVNAGSACYGLLTAFGFAMALARWPSAWAILRAGGVVYLGWLGAQSLVKAATASSPSRPLAAGVPQQATTYLYEGFLTNAFNPAIATFYLVLLPQFIPRDAPIVQSTLALTAVHIGLAAPWHVTWAAAGGTLARVLAQGRARQIIEGVTGVMLLILAFRIAIR